MPQLWPGGPAELPLTVTFDGQEITFAEVPAHELMRICAAADWFAILLHINDSMTFLGLLDRLADDGDLMDHDHLHYLATTVLGRLSGLYIPHEPGPDPEAFEQAAQPRHERWVRILQDLEDPADLLTIIGRGEDELPEETETPQRGTSGWQPAVAVSGYMIRYWGLFSSWCMRNGMDPLTLPFHQLMPAGVAWMADHIPNADPEAWKKLGTRLFTDPDPAPWPVVGDARLRRELAAPRRRGRAYPIPQPKELPLTHPSRREELEVVKALMAGRLDMEGDRDWMHAEPR